MMTINTKHGKQQELSEMEIPAVFYMQEIKGGAPANGYDRAMGDQGQAQKDDQLYRKPG